jgi:vacuolar-type H+-ATPase subunit F/Vma7
MREIVFIGDEVTAAGFRLAGIESFAPDRQDLVAVVKAEAPTARVLMMAAAAHAALPDTLARALAAGPAPLLALVPDAQGHVGVPDMEAEVRRALGIEV